jgi:hypothetical protein
LRVPWAESAAVRRDLEELKHIPEAALNEALATVRVGGNGLQGGIVTREPSPRHTTPAPPVGAQQQQGFTEGPTTTDRDRAPADAPQLADAKNLAEAFYRGLGGEVTAVTAAIRPRDLVIASDLVAAGPTLSEPRPTRWKRVRPADALRPSTCGVSNGNGWDGWRVATAGVARVAASRWGSTSCSFWPTCRASCGPAEQYAHPPGAVG